MVKKALFAGTFSPPTLGHLDVIRRATTICDKLVVGIGVNMQKPDQSFTVLEKQEMLQRLLIEFPRVEVVVIEGLVADYAKKHQIDFLIRGLRGFNDLEYESMMASTNRQIREIETVFLLPDPKYHQISSTLIHEIARYGQSLGGFVPEGIEDFVFRRLTEHVPK